jgi:hypothetical protein
MLKISKSELTSEGCDFGVEFEGDEEVPGAWVYEAWDERDARRVQRIAGGKLIVRDVYVTDWAEVEGQ